MKKKNTDNKNNKHIKKISIKLLIISSILVFLLSIGATYAALTWNSGNTLISGQTMCFGIGYSKGQDIDFGTVNSSGEVINGMTASTSFDINTAPYTVVGFKRKNNCLLYGKGTLKVNITSSSAPLSSGALKYVVYEYANNTETQVASGSITSTGETTVYDNFDIINTVYYYIFFWLDSHYISNSYLETNLTGTIEASARSAPAYGPITEEDPASYTYFYSQATLDTDAGVDFSKTSVQNNTNGLYIFSETKDYFYPIVYYRGNVNNNLIFADTCWKIIRTTESGGLRLIYNGSLKQEYTSTEVISESKYTNISNDATYPYTFDSSTLKWTSSNHTHRASAEISFTVSEAGDYVINYEVSSEANYDKAYFYKNNVELANYSGTVSGNIDLSGLTTADVIKVKYTKDGSGSRDNDNVIFSISKGIGDKTTSCNNTGTDSQITTKAFNSSYNLPAYVGYMYGTVYTRSSGTGTDWYYAPDVTYSNGEYTLTAKGSYNVETKSTISGTNLNYQHYTCGSSTDTTCTQVRYVYYVSSTTAYYITLSNGKKVEDALSEMLDYNTTSSTIKGNGASAASGTIDYWYKNNIDNNSSYKSLIDYNEIFCNDRSFATSTTGKKFETSGWNPDGGSVSQDLYFSAIEREFNFSPSITCSRNIDKFTVTTASTGNKTLTYPVGLITADEVMMAGATGGTSNSTYYLYTGQNWWTGSPAFFYLYTAYGFDVNASGRLDGDHVSVSNPYGVRPVIALKADYEITGGDGSTGSPFIVEGASGGIM